MAIWRGEGLSSMLFERMRGILSLLLVVSGIFLLFVLEYLSRTVLLDVPYELLDNLSIVLALAGLLLFLNERTNRIIESFRDEFFGMKRAEVEELRISSVDEIIEILEKRFHASTVDVGINYHAVNRATASLVDYLLHRRLSKETRILVGGIDEVELGESDAGSKLLENRLLISWLRRQSRHDMPTTIKYSKASLPSTMIIGFTHLLIVTPYTLRSDVLLYILLDRYSDVGSEYYKYFEDAWRNSQDLGTFLR